jgi:uridine kinase
MFEKFVFPGKLYADLVIPGINNDKEVTKIIEYLQ